MRTLLSRLLYHVGDMLSLLLRYNHTGWLIYPLYNKAMLISSWLDIDNRVWGDKNNLRNDLKVNMVRDSYRPYLDKYEHNQNLLNRKINKK